MVTEKRRSKTGARRKPEPQFVTDAKGKRTAVIVPIEEYEALTEDVEDNASMDEREDEPTVPWQDVKKRLRADGLLQD